MSSKSSQINAIWSLKTVPLSICLKTSRAGAQCSYRNGTDLPGFGLRVQSQFSEAQAAALRNLGPTTYLIVSLFPSSLPRGRDFGGSGDLVRAAWRRGRPTGMTRASSVDLRKRVAAAVEGGASCHQAAARFGVRSSGAIRRYARVETGRGQSQAAGGDRRCGRIEAHAAAILAALERKSDITPADLLSRRGLARSIR